MSNMSEKNNWTTGATMNSKEYTSDEPCPACGSFTRRVNNDECSSCRKARAIAFISNTAKRTAQHDIALRKELRDIERSYSLPAGL